MPHPRVTSAIRAFNGAVCADYIDPSSAHKSLDYKRQQRATRKATSALSWDTLTNTIKRRSSDQVVSEKLQKITRLSRQFGEQNVPAILKIVKETNRVCVFLFIFLL